MDLYTQYAIAVAKEAVSDSGLDVEKEDLNKIGVIFGAGMYRNVRTDPPPTWRKALSADLTWIL